MLFQLLTENWEKLQVSKKKKLQKKSLTCEYVPVHVCMCLEIAHH